MTKLFRKFRGLMIPAILVSLVIGADTAFAAEDSFQDFLQTWGRILSLLGSLINVILWVVIKFIGDLLTNDFIFGAGIEDMLLSIWQTVRNFVNIAFVFVLLVIAFYNIVSVDPEKIPLKKSLGKVAIALILVNFSYFAAKVVLDVANVLTTAVFAIPRDIITDAELSSAENEFGPSAIHAQCHKRIDKNGENAPDTEIFNNYDTEEMAGRTYALIPTKCYIPNIVKVELFNGGDPVEGEPSLVESTYDKMKVILYYKDDAGVLNNLTESENAVANGTKSLSDHEAEFKNAELTAKKFGRNSITMILAKTMFDINKLTEVSAAASTGFLGLTISGIVNILLLLLYGVMFVAMFIVLIFRVVYLWICIAFSPLVALMFVFKDFGIEMGEFDLQKIFIQYAFVPVKMGIALSVGVLMLFKANQQSAMQQTVEQIGPGITNIQIPIDSIISNDASLQKLMWNIATVAVIWIAVKWSMKDLSGPVSGITERIFGYVEDVGKVVRKLPLTLPIAPYANSEDGKDRGYRTAGEVLRSARASNLDRIVEGQIRGESGKYGQMRQDIGDKLRRITSKSQEGELKKDITHNDDYMTHIMNDESTANRNQLADKLVLMGAVNKDYAEKTFKGEGKSSPQAFRNLLSTMEHENREAFFKDKDVQSAWQESGKAGLRALPASKSPLIGESDQRVNEGEWEGGKDARDDARKEIKGSLDGLEAIGTEGKAARKIIEDNLHVEKEGGKYHPKQTQEVVKKAVDQLIAASRLSGDKERKALGAELKGQEKTLFDSALGKMPKPASEPPAPTPRQKPPAGNPPANTP